MVNRMEEVVPPSDQNSSNIEYKTWSVYTYTETAIPKIESVMQSITFEASDRSRSLPLALSSELSLAPIREIACYKLFSI